VSEQTLFILAVLVGVERHGYGIAREVETLSEGRVRLTAGTLYGALTRLSKDGLVEAASEQIVEGRRRRYYRLTAAGAAAVEAEVARLRAMTSALDRRLAPQARPGLA
jgi:PadR family transcriptional regulator PadR